MTNKEQTISNLKKLKSFHNGSYGADIDKAIKVLEQKPCEDYVSREAFIELYKEWMHSEYGKTPDDDALAIRAIKALPSVYPVPKIGHWIKQKDGTYKCSNCKKYELWEGFYCASCGAKMVEPQESEVE